jgi:hypothetical protein
MNEREAFIQLKILDLVGDFSNKTNSSVKISENTVGTLECSEALASAKAYHYAGTSLIRVMRKIWPELKKLKNENSG